MTARTCGNCRWWNVYGDSDKIQGHCVRHAPRPAVSLDAEPYTAWPVTQSEDTCGEWADASTTPEQDERRELVRQFAVAMIARKSGEMMHEIWQMASEMADAEPDLVTKPIS